MGDLSSRLAMFALSPPETGDAAEIMRLSLLDWAAVGCAGRDEPVAGLMRAQACEEGGRPEASIIAGATRVPARMAAWVNGTTSHALDYDDTHFAHIGHPSVAVIPAALAVAQRQGADMATFQEACLVGVEASIRFGLWLGRDHYQIGFHQTATAGAFGATLAAGRLLGLTRDQMRMALGVVSTRASGLKSQFGTMGKPLNAGIAAQNGVEAALLAARDFVSAPGGLETVQGFGPTHHGQAEESAFDRMGEAWLFTTVQHKFHACCHGLHATLEAISSLNRSADEVAGITVHTHPRWCSVCDIANPRTGLEAKFSYRMVLAMALAGYDTARLDSFADALCSDPGLVQLRDRVDVVSDESLSEMQARLLVRLKDGAEVELFHDLDAPLPLEARRHKIHAKAASLIGLGVSDRMWSSLKDGTDLEAFADLLTF